MPEYLEWERGLLSWIPRWAAEPSVEDMKRLAEQVLSSVQTDEEDVEDAPEVQVTFLAQGGLNKLYQVKAAPSSTYVLRVPLPLDPFFKTESEAATLDYILLHTSLPVPRVVAFNPTSWNTPTSPPKDTFTASDSASRYIGHELGLEWMLMEFMPGQTLETAWETMKWQQKEAFVKEVAASLAQLIRQRFDRVGSLYHKAISSDSAESFTLGNVVSPDFFGGPSHLQQRVSRGPFTNSREWLDARLELIIKECDSKLLNGADMDEDDIEDSEDCQALADQLRASISEFFPQVEDRTEVFCLYRGDLSWRNLLVDDNGCLSAISDWESAYTAPTWKAYEIPAFLKEAVSSGEEPDMFKEHLLEYEQTALRDVFKNEMDRLIPGWTLLYEQSQRKVDFEFAVDACDNGLWCSRAHNWLDETLAGDSYRLRGSDYCP